MVFLNDNNENNTKLIYQAILFTLTITFVFVIIISYRSARPRYKPEHFTDIFKDFSWLGDWPKWLDFPLMQPLNSGFDWLIVKYGLFFEGINNFLLGLYTSMKNSLVGLPWPIVIAIVIFITYFASGRKTNTTVLVAFCTFFLGFLSPRYWDKCIMTTCIVLIGMLMCIVIGNPNRNCNGKKQKSKKCIVAYT